MINDISVKSKNTNNKAKVAFYVTFVLSVIIFAVSFFINRFSGVVGNVGLILIAVSILIYTKYVAPVYYYDIMRDSSGAAVFVVRAVTGKRQSTFCRIGLAEIVKIEREDRAARRAHKTPAGVRKYSYVPTLSPDVTHRIYTRSRYERAEIIIEASDEFAALLSEYSIAARLEEIDTEE